MTTNQWYAVAPIVGYLALYFAAVVQTAIKAAKREDYEPTKNAKRASRIVNEDPDVRLYHLIAMFVNSLICIAVGYIIGRIR